MSNIKETQKNYYIKKSNDLTQGSFEMSVIAYRIVLLAGTDKFLKQLIEHPDAPIRITAHDYHNLFGTGNDMSPSYRAIKEAADELLNAKVKVKNIDRYSDGSKWKGGFNWVTEAFFNPDLKVIEVQFTKQVLPLIKSVNTNYTYYNLRHIGKLSSMYSIRMYELMMMWRKKGRTPILSVGYMRNYLGVPDNSYNKPEDLKDFNRYVIKKSVEEVTKKTNIEMEFEPDKEGRKTVGYKFSYTEKDVVDGEAKEIPPEGFEDESTDEDGLPKLGF